MTALTLFPVTGDYLAVDDPEPFSTSSDPSIEAVQGLVQFYPRLPKGFTVNIADYNISPNANAEQNVTLIGAITGGVFGLNFNGLWTDPYIAAGASAATVQAALAAIPTVGTGNVVVTKAAGVGTPYVCRFIGALAASPQPQMLSDANDLVVSSGTPHVSVITIAVGSTQRQSPTAIGLPPREGRIWTTGQLCSINRADSPDVVLAANADLDIDFDLIYDVSFTRVWMNDEPRTLAPFGFVAPTDDTPVCITDPALERLPYFRPLQDTWYPGWSPYVPPSASGNVASITHKVPQRTWRERATA